MINLPDSQISTEKDGKYSLANSPNNLFIVNSKNVPLENSIKCPIETGKILQMIGEYQNNSLNYQFHSKISVSNISLDLINYQSSKLGKYFSTLLTGKIMRNINQRIIDQSEQNRKFLQQYLNNIWLNIFHEKFIKHQSSNINPQNLSEQINFNLNIKEDLAIQKLSKRFNNEFLKINHKLEMKDFLSKIQLKPVYMKSNIHLQHRWIVTNDCEHFCLLKINSKKPVYQYTQLFKIKHNIESNFSSWLIKLRICLMIIDGLLLLHRLYGVYGDIKKYFYGKDQFIFLKNTDENHNQIILNKKQYIYSANYFNTNFVLMQHFYNNCFCFNSNPVAIHHSTHSKFYNSQQFLTIVILIGIFLIVIIIFVLIQSPVVFKMIDFLFCASTNTLWLSNTTAKSTDLSLQSYLQKRFKMKQLTKNDQLLMPVSRVFQFQEYIDQLNINATCRILRIITGSTNNKQLHRVMQSQYLFIPLFITDKCVSLQHNTQRDKYQMLKPFYSRHICNRTFSSNSILKKFQIALSNKPLTSKHLMPNISEKHSTLIYILQSLAVSIILTMLIITISILIKSLLYNTQHYLLGRFHTNTVNIVTDQHQYMMLCSQLTSQTYYYSPQYQTDTSVMMEMMNLIQNPPINNYLASSVSTPNDNNNNNSNNIIITPVDTPDVDLTSAGSSHFKFPSNINELFASHSANITSYQKITDKSTKETDI